MNYQPLLKYLEDRTITKADIDKYGITIVGPSEGAEVCGFRGPLPGSTAVLVLPGNEGSGYCHTIWQIGGGGGFAPRPVSFQKMNVKGISDVVLLPGWDWAVPPETALVAESYIKGIVLARLGYPVIVFNGVTGYSAGEGTVVPRLTRLPWAHQRVRVVLCFDSINTRNEKSAFNVRAAKSAAGGLFHRYFGSTILDLDLPPPTDTREDWGVDDYVAANGLPALAEHLAVAGELAVNELTAAISEFNQRFALVEELGKVATVKPPFRFMSKETFTLNYGNEWASVTTQGARPGDLPSTKQQQIAKCWLIHPNRLTLDRVRFLPGEDRFVEGNLNVWSGFAVEPDASGVDEAEDYFAALIREAIPDGGEWLLDALASLVQQPERRTGWYVYLLGQKGTGKGYVTGLLKAIFGSDRGHAPSLTVENYCNKFNAAKASARLLMIDELPAPMKKDLLPMFEAELKLDADPNALTRPLEPKGKDLVYTDRNCTVLLSSNYMPEWPIEWGDRRAACFQFREEMCILDAMRPYGTKDYTWWERRFNWRDNGGAAKVLAWLLERDIGAFEPEAAPFITGLKKQIVGHHGDDFRGWLQQVKIDPSILEYDGQPLMKYRYMTTEQLAMIYHAGDVEMPDKRRIVSYGRLLYNLQFEGKVCKYGPRGAQREIRAWRLHGPSEASGSTIVQDFIQPLSLLLSRSVRKHGV